MIDRAERLRRAENGWYVDSTGRSYPSNMWAKADAPAWVGCMDCATGTPYPVPSEYMELIPELPTDPGDFDRET